jgi:hypothetical protein
LKKKKPIATVEIGSPALIVSAKLGGAKKTR